MSDELFFDGVRFVSAAEAGSASDLTRDYIGRLCREGKVNGRRVGHKWYVEIVSLEKFVHEQSLHKQALREEITRTREQEYQTKTILSKSAFVESPAMFVKGSIQDQLGRAAMRAVATLPAGSLDVAARSMHVPVHSISPLTDLMQKVVALTLAVAITFGTYAAVDPDYARYVLETTQDQAHATFAAISDHRDIVGTVTTRAESALAAAGENPTATITQLFGIIPAATQSIAKFVYEKTNDVVYAIAYPRMLTNSPSIAGTSSDGSTLVSMNPYQPNSSSTVEVTKENTIANTSRGPSQIITQLLQPVVQQQIINQGGISETYLNQRLNDLETRLNNRSFGISQSFSTAIAQTNSVVSLTNKIDKLEDVTITGSTFAGTITDSDISADSLAVSGSVTFDHALSSGSGGTGYSTYNPGDILYASSTGQLETLAAGTDGDVLTLSSGFPSWQAGGGGGGVSTSVVNSWSALQIFNGGASTTKLSVYANAYFGATATSSFDSTGFLTLPSGFLSSASSTIGSGTQAGGLTINGGATTTGRLIVQGTGTSTFAGGVQTTALNVTGSATSTFTNGFNITNGCFAVNGTCISGSGGGGSSASSTLLSDSNTFTGTMRLAGTYDENSTFAGIQIGNVGTPRILFGNGNASQNFQIDNDNGTFRWYLPGNTLMNLSATGLGVNTGTAAASALSVYGGVNIGSGYYSTAAPTNGAIIQGNVGIGNTNPWTALSVTGGFAATASSTIGGGTQATGLTISGGATTTGRLIVQGNGTSTFAGGVSLTTISGAGLSSCSGTSDKLLYNSATGVFSCGTDQSGSGGGGSDTNWTFFNNYGIRPATTSNQVLIGTTGTSSNSKLEVVGGAAIDYASTTAASATTGYFATASTTNLTATTATTTNLAVTSVTSGIAYGNSLGQISTLTLPSYVTATGGTLAIADAVANGSTKGIASFAAADFDASSGNISIDYTNGQAASGSQKGFLTSADWTTFNSKLASSSISSSAMLASLLSDETGTGSAVFSASPTFSGTLAAASILATASSTIGDGTAAGGLTVSGTATTTNLTVTGVTSGIHYGNSLGQVSTLTLPSYVTATGGTLAISNAAADGSTKGIATFASADFDASSGTISLDYTNGQKASGSQAGFLSSADWTTFNNKAGTASPTFTGTATFASLIATASSTIGGGTQATGLTISGGATTTGSLVVQGSATSTFSYGISTTYLNVTGTSATSTFARGIDLSGGCFSVSGTCLTSGGASVSSANTWTQLQTFQSGFVSQASSTIGGGTAATGLTVNGTATTTNLTITGVTSGILYGNTIGQVSTLTLPSYVTATGGVLAIADAVADGSTKGIATFTAADFNSSSGNISIDYTNGQAASGSQKGFLTSADWTTFNSKLASSSIPNSSALAGLLSDETGTGNAVFSASPTFTGTITAAAAYFNGNVGIGTTTPFRLFSLAAAAATPQVSVAYDNTRVGEIRTDSSGDLNIGASGNDTFWNNDNLWVCTGGSITTNGCPSGAPSGQGNLFVENRFGIGTSTLGTSNANNIFTIDLQNDSTSNLLSISTSTTGYGSFKSIFKIGSNGFVGISSSTPTTQLSIGGLLTVGANSAAAATMGTATSTFNGDIKILGKLDVATIDPVYMVDDVKYATYGNSTIGIHEETLETIQLQQKGADGKYEYRINFNDLEKGSDLWLFYQITEFGDKWQSLFVQLTPSFDGTVYYQKLPEENTLVIKSNQPGEVSMRLSGNRYDFSKWPNLRPDQDGDTRGVHVVPGK